MLNLLLNNQKIYLRISIQTFLLQMHLLYEIQLDFSEKEIQDFALQLKSLLLQQLQLSDLPFLIHFQYKDLLSRHILQL